MQKKTHHVNLCLGSCKTRKKYPCSGIFGDTQKKFYKKLYEECERLCCRDPKCQSFDHRILRKYDYNCALYYETKDDAGKSYKTGTCQDVDFWNHYE